MVKDATEKIRDQKGRFIKYQERNGRGKTSKTSGRYCFERSKESQKKEKIIPTYTAWDVILEVDYLMDHHPLWVPYEWNTGRIKYDYELKQKIMKYEKYRGSK